MTLAEVLLWQELKSKQMLGRDFDRQKPIDEFIVDFYCKELFLAIEIDGDSHFHDDASLRDEVRQKRLESLGVRFLRFDDLDVKQNMGHVLNTIYEWIIKNNQYTPTPNPSKEGTCKNKRWQKFNNPRI